MAKYSYCITELQKYILILTKVHPCFYLSISYLFVQHIHDIIYCYHALLNVFKNIFFRIKRIMAETLTSYSLVIMHHDKIYAVRDPFGNRPLCLGKLLPAAAFSGKKLITDEDIDGWVVSSESCNFISMGARYYREVLPGILIKPQNMQF